MVIKNFKATFFWICQNSTCQTTFHRSTVPINNSPLDDYTTHLPTYLPYSGSVTQWS